MARTVSVRRRIHAAPAAALLAVLVGVGACTSPGGTGEATEPAATSPATQAPPEAREGDMLVTLLGTGSPVLTMDRMGNSTLVQAGGLDLVFDAGRGAAVRLRQAGVGPGDVDATFITHFHSDHINGLADMWMMGYIPAIGARAGAFQLYGPTGTADLGSGLMQAYKQDAVVRMADGEVKPETIGIQTHEFAQDGVVFEQNGVKVTMFTVDHDPAEAIVPAVGYRVDYNGNSMLVSGDTRPAETVVQHGTGVDVLIHEVADFPDPALPVIQGVYAHHTSPQQAGEIFTRTRPELAVYSHIVNGVPPNVPTQPIETIIERTRQTYDGPLVVGEDLMSFTISGGAVTQNPVPQN